MRTRLAIVVMIGLGAFTLTGCTTYQIGFATTRYEEAAKQVDLGDSKDKVVELLGPTQRTLSQRQRKQPDRFMKDGVLVEVLYFRSGWQSDGLTTDDEFTPYVFNDGKLVGIGWQILGGPRTQGQARDNINVHQSSTTIVH